MKNSKARDLAGTLLAVLGLGVLLWRAPQAALAAKDGVALCLTVVIPSLFPFLVMSRLVLQTGFERACRRILGPLMEPAFHLPRQGASALVLGLLGGYPVGAAAAASLHTDGQLTRQQAEELLGFCSNAGPAFFFGMLGGIFRSEKTAAILYGIHVVSALLTGLILQAGRKRGSRVPQRFFPVQKSTASIYESAKTMCLICAYIILFRVVCSILGSFLPDVPALRVGLMGLLEMTGGCCALPELGAPGLRYCLASGFSAFGGLCVFMQTRSVLDGSGLRGSQYLTGKAIQAVTAVLMTWALMVAFPGLLPREMPTAYLPSHAGLLPSTAAVTALCLVILGIWCIYLRFRAGNEEESIV